MVKYGEKIGQKIIADTEISVYSNGDCHHVSEDYAYDDAGDYLGLQYQCVEFIRRFIYKSKGVNLAKLWSYGDAQDWHDNHESMGLSKIRHNDVQEGDIITFSGGQWGHVAIISQVGDVHISLTGQNFYNNKRDIDEQFLRSELFSQQPIQDTENNNYVFQSILRLQG